MNAGLLSSPPASPPASAPLALPNADAALGRGADLFLLATPPAAEETSMDAVSPTPNIETAPKD